ncbi:MAG: TonB-dependent receptor [Pedobacter sp.]|nr:MAG: TonB-dependent receptor [Pedobacter sp.]
MNRNLLRALRRNLPCLNLRVPKCIGHVLLLTMVFASFSARAQITITGSVKDTNAESLAGVSIAIKGTKTVTFTNGDGKFTIQSRKVTDTLVFTSVGFQSQEVVIGSKKNIDIVLNESASALNEVVVIGYGTSERKDLTGSVGSVKMADLLKAPVASFDEALAGRVAGVQVTTADGQPGQAPTIIIRGANSITQDNSPLYVVDGFPLENFANNTLNPAEIETIDILKDASSTAIYGARGANGVIMITTKKGQVGSPTISYQNWFGQGRNLKKMEMMSPYEFVRYQKEYGGAVAATYRDLEFYRGIQGVDWQDLIFQNASSSNHFISVNGGTTATKYAISGSVFNQEGAIINSGFNRYQGRIVLNQTISPKLSVGINTNFTNAKTFGQIFRDSENGSATSYTMYSAWGSRPVNSSGETDVIIDILDDPEVDNLNDYRINPVLNLNNVYNPVFSNTLIANAHVDYKILKNLTFRTTGGVTRTSRRAERFFNSLTSGGSILTPIGQTNGINGSISDITNNNWLNENTLTYNKTFAKKHSLNVLGGFTMQGTDITSSGYSAIQLPNESLGINGLDEGVVSTVLSSSLSSTLASFLGRVNYGYMNKYLFSASFRADGSSKFPKINRWGYFPTASLGWVISREKFMKNIPVVSFAKLRASYGLNGNNRVSEFGYLPALQLNFFSGSANTASSYAFNNTVQTGAAAANLGNSNLKWETTAQLDVGFEIGLLKDRISLVSEYYNKKTTDLLLNATLAPSMGYKTAFKNIGAVLNQGFEFTINTNNINSQNFKWNSSFNISFNRNKVLSLNEDQPSLATAVGWNSNFSQTQPYIAVPGRPISMFYGLIWDGVYQLSDFNQLPNGTYQIKSNVVNYNSNSQPGHIKYRDLNGDGIINNLDYSIIGNPNPLHIGGFTNNFVYKGFDLNVFFQWSYGNEIFNTNRIEFEGQTARIQLNMFASYADRWSLDNQSSTNHVVRGGGANVYSSRVVEDGSYLRLKTVALGYSLPSSWTKKIAVSSLRIYTSGQNLITWTNYSGLDPEVSTRPGALTQGFDFSPYPKARTITFGLNAKF